jgi:hypothetical protein
MIPDMMRREEEKSMKYLFFRENPITPLRNFVI